MVQEMVRNDTRCTDLRLWVVLKCTSCTDWDGGWIGKVSRVRYVLWIVLLESDKDQL
jgi:hypothetical protein